MIGISICYRELFALYSQEAKIKSRWMVRIPFLTPKLSSYWVTLVTPIELSLIRPLIEGLRTKTVCTDHRINELIPQYLSTCRHAIRAAIDPEQHFKRYDVRMLNGPGYSYEWSRPGDPLYSGGQVFTRSFELNTESSSAEIWKALEPISEELSYCYDELLWRWWRRADAFAGEVSYKVGLPGTTIKSKDGVFWKVVESVPKERLAIIAEVEVFGWMLMEFLVEPYDDGVTKLILNLKFHPRGLGGIAYWYATTSVHQVVFYGIMDWVARCLDRECRITYH